MRTTLVGLCAHCNGDANLISGFGLREVWCNSCGIMLNDEDIVIPVDSAPEFVYDNDPIAKGMVEA